MAKPPEYDVWAARPVINLPSDPASKRPLPRKAYSAIFSTPDYEYNREKRIKAMKLGASAGYMTGLYKSIVSVKEPFVEVVSGYKLRTVGIVTGWILAGAVTARLYIAGVQQLSEKRQKEDDPLNHFVMGAAVSIPFSVLASRNMIVQSIPKSIFLRGTLFGALGAFFKWSASTNFFQYYYVDREFESYCRYPSMYAAQEAFVRYYLQKHERREQIAEMGEQIAEMAALK